MKFIKNILNKLHLFFVGCKFKNKEQTINKQTDKQENAWLECLTAYYDAGSTMTSYLDNLLCHGLENDSEKIEKAKTLLDNFYNEFQPTFRKNELIIFPNT